MFRSLWRDLCASIALGVVSTAVLANLGTLTFENATNAAGISLALGFSGIFRS